jgi:hypothetical protein
MGNLHLVTGYAGEAHVASSDQGSLFEALIRSGQFVMDAGAKFAASIVSNNQIRVNDGELMMQGRHVKLIPGAYVDLAIENGTQGYLRKDLIVVRYTKNADTGIEECSLIVIKGTPAESNPADPEYTTGIINADGALQHDFPLYKVNLSGLSIEGLTALFETQKSLYDSMLRLIGGTMAGNIAMDGHKVTGLGTPTANGDAVPLKYAKDNFAPNGFGLGETNGTYTADICAINKAGFYRANSATANKPNGFDNCVIYANIVDGDVYLVATYAEMTAQRYYSSYAKAWQPWEYINPPMFPGVEYRTTERYHNVPVYKKVDASGNILWRKDGETQWHMLSSASYVAAATVE